MFDRLDDPVLLTIIAIAAGCLIALATIKKTKKDLKVTEKKVTQNVVDALEANRRVEQKGGKINYRDDEKVVSTLTKPFSVDAIIAEPENKKKESKVVSTHDLSHSTDSYIAESDDQSDNAEDK